MVQIWLLCVPCVHPVRSRSPTLAPFAELFCRVKRNLNKLPRVGNSPIIYWKPLPFALDGGDESLCFIPPVIMTPFNICGCRSRAGQEPGTCSTAYHRFQSGHTGTATYRNLPQVFRNSPNFYYYSSECFVPKTGIRW